MGAEHKISRIGHKLLYKIHLRSSIKVRRIESTIIAF
jgi:hypothetical protein